MPLDYTPPPIPPDLPPAIVEQVMPLETDEGGQQGNYAQYHQTRAKQGQDAKLRDAELTAEMRRRTEQTSQGF